MGLDSLSVRFHQSQEKAKPGGLWRDGTFKGEKLGPFKPGSYMNRSGIPVSEIVRFYKIPLAHVIVFHDELDLPLRKIRVKTGGGNGGHNGLKSLDSHIGNAYVRVRIGIGHPGDKALVTGYVLNNFAAQEQSSLADILQALSTHADLLLQGDHAGYMNQLAQSLSSNQLSGK